jgi:hypothetical protein
MQGCGAAKPAYLDKNSGNDDGGWWGSLRTAPPAVER